MTMKEKAIAWIVKQGGNEAEAASKVERYFDLAIRQGFKTAKEIGQAVTWFAAV